MAISKSLTQAANSLGFILQADDETDPSDLTRESGRLDAAGIEIGNALSPLGYDRINVYLLHALKATALALKNRKASLSIRGSARPQDLKELKKIEELLKKIPLKKK